MHPARGRSARPPPARDPDVQSLPADLTCSLRDGVGGLTRVRRGGRAAGGGRRIKIIPPCPAVGQTVILMSLLQSGTSC
ncbi:hypothetical protein EVAR_97529_1 [Eumeta japonica]|uniref:Uncharacterized protein n=1 Tax=Eumeta variegata TaxID=151549 RepID=A0A4C1WP11_EUMVA|nr:hypothetical protein EVAR_97529_1 [Eumeta japonica]